MCTVRVELDANIIVVSSPYSPELPARAKKLGGKWDAASRAWRFDARLEADVAGLYTEIYGEWTGQTVEYVTLVAEAQNMVSAEKGGIFLADRCLARAFGRDSGAKLGEGVICRAGGFDSGGSTKYWTTIAAKGTVVEIMDVPRAKAEQALAEADEDWKLSIKAGSSAIDRAGLEAEKARLLARIAEIDALLAK